MIVITATTGTSSQSRFQLFFLAVFFFRDLRRPDFEAAVSFLLLDLCVGCALQILEQFQALEKIDGPH